MLLFHKVSHSRLNRPICAFAGTVLVLIALSLSGFLPFFNITMRYSVAAGFALTVLSVFAFCLGWTRISQCFSAILLLSATVSILSLKEIDIPLEAAVDVRLDRHMPAHHFFTGNLALVCAFRLAEQPYPFYRSYIGH